MLQDSATLLHQLAELSKRNQRPPSLIDDGFKKQSAFLRDPARLKAGFCTRRAGKSYGAATLLFETALDMPGSSCLYIALTRDSAKRIMWKDCIKVINRRHGLGAVFNETSLTATLPNGSVIYLTGADAKPDEMDKLLGQKYPLVIIDEAASWKQDLRKLVYGILKPAVADYRGTIMLIGTPGNFTTGLFFDVTNGKEPGWALHKWTTFDNPYICNQWKAEIDELIANNPLIQETPLFKQMYLGQWFIDSEKLVYKFGDDRNLVAELPVAKEWFYVLGVDLGYDPDPSAFVLCAYSPHSPTLYIIETYKQGKMIISDVAERIKYTLKQYPHCRVIMDASAKQAVEEMRQRYSIPIEAAEKTGKSGFIELMNSDLILGKIKCLEGVTDPLIEEWAQLVWDEHSSRREEHPGCANHLSDAALYSWRWAYNYAWTNNPGPKPHPSSERAVDEFFEQEAERIQSAKEKPFWETM